MTTHAVRWDAAIGGIIFALISGIWLADYSGLIDFELAWSLNVNYILPTVLIIGGLLGIAATLRSPKSTGETHE